MSAPLSIVFAGTPEFSVPALEAVLRTGHRVAAVYTQPDRPAGRGRHLTASPVKLCAESHGIRVEQPPNFKGSQNVEQLRSFQPDLMVVVAYGLILPQAVLDLPRLGCLNIHASLLPRWRGAAPIQRAILAGDAHTGVGIMQMEAGLDTGPVWLEERTVIESRDTGSSLHDRLASLGAQLLVQALDVIVDGTARPQPQATEGITYAHKLRKEEARIDWTQTARDIDRRVRAFNPWPVAETSIDGEQLRVWDALPLDHAATSQPGQIMRVAESGIDVATGQGMLRLTRIQLAGRKAVSAAEFARGRTLQHLVLG